MAQSSQAAPQETRIQKGKIYVSFRKRRLDRLSKKSKTLSPRMAAPKEQTTAKERRAVRSEATAQETRTCIRGLRRLNDVSTERKSRSIWPPRTAPASIQNDQSV